MPAHDFSSNEVLTAALVDGYLNNSYYAMLRQATPQAIANNTWTSIAFATEVFDSDSGHDNVTNNSRYVAQTAGVYLVGGGVGFAANNTGNRWVRIALNGTAINGSGNRVASTATFIMSVVTRWILVTLAVSDYLELQAHQSSGGSLDTDATAEQMSTLTIVRLST